MLFWHRRVDAHAANAWLRDHIAKALDFGPAQDDSATYYLTIRLCVSKYRAHRQESMTRTYTLKKRAEQQAETRQRIVDAAVELHSTVGPLATTLEHDRREGRRAAPHPLRALPRRAQHLPGLLGGGARARPEPDRRCLARHRRPHRAAHRRADRHLRLVRAQRAASEQRGARRRAPPDGAGDPEGARAPVRPGLARRAGRGASTPISARCFTSR